MAQPLLDAVPELNPLQPPLNLFVAVSLLRFLAETLVDRAAAATARDAATSKMAALLAHLDNRGVTLELEPADEDYQLLFTFRPTVKTDRLLSPPLKQLLPAFAVAA